MTVIKIKGDPSFYIIIRAGYSYSRKIRKYKEVFLHTVYNQYVAFTEQGTVTRGKAKR